MRADSKVAASLEPVRLVVWDLDETFWHGTLSEGGIRYRRDTHEMVVQLARRGIVSSLCSKNALAAVKAELEREAIWDYFVFPSVSWEPKGPRLARLVERVQLRAPTVLFIDDNPMNLAEARHYVPGIQTADETFVHGMLDNPLLRGRPDPDLSRLKQYRLLQRRKADAVEAGDDNASFLRESQVTVTIEHDLESHLDRAVELINRTNQLNFTKTRLSEDPEQARQELRRLLSGYATQAGIVRVQDRYGDYGYCGLYVMNSGPIGRRLKHFCFSCRILDMGIESWLYRRLGRPQLRIKGDVLNDVVRDERVIDWVRFEPSDVADRGKSDHVLDYVYARGGCDLHAIMHYFHLVSRAVHGEFNRVENGTMMPLQHSMFARYALNGIPEEALNCFSKIGYRNEHFESALTSLPHGRAVWVLSFWSEADHALYSHKATSQPIPIVHASHKATLADMTADNAVDSGLDPQFRNIVKDQFSYTGMIGEDDFKANLILILERVSPGTLVFILKATDRNVAQNGAPSINRRKQLINTWTESVVADRPFVTLLDIASYAGANESTENPNHFDRMVYYRVYKDIMQRVQDDQTQPWPA